MVQSRHNGTMYGQHMVELSEFEVYAYPVTTLSLMSYLGQRPVTTNQLLDDDNSTCVMGITEKYVHVYMSEIKPIVGTVKVNTSTFQELCLYAATNFRSQMFRLCCINVATMF